MVHDFIKFPELTNGQMQIYYFQSPHKQITENFSAEVVKVVDGDTIRVRASFRDFDFPIRIAEIAAPELSEGGQASQKWLEGRILGKRVDVEINSRNRVGRYGRLIGKIRSGGFDMGELLMIAGMAVPFDQSAEALIPEINKTLAGAAI